MPRSLSRSPSRCRNTSPRDLAMSRMPILRPSRRSGRGRRGLIVGLRSEVGSSNTLMYASFSPAAVIPAKAGTQGPQGRAVALGPRLRGGDDSLRSNLTCHRKAAAGTARGPAGDDAGEHTGVAAGMDDHNAARTELVDRSAGERLGPAFGDALGAGDEVGTGDLAQPMELFIEPRLRPSGILEGAMVLGANHEQRVASGGVLDVAQRLQGFGKAPRQALRVARLLVDDTLQPIAGEHRYRRLARLDAVLDRQRLPARPP